MGRAKTCVWTAYPGGGTVLSCSEVCVCVGVSVCVCVSDVSMRGCLSEGVSGSGVLCIHIRSSRVCLSRYIQRDI